MARGIRVVTRLPSFLTLQSRPRVSRSFLNIHQHLCRFEPGFSTRPDSTTTKIYRTEYNWIEGVETLERYRPGGYHPMTVGDILNDRYYIADKLGFGGYSPVWLAHDTHQKQYVALKASIADSLSRETKVLKALSNPPSSPVHTGRSSVPALLDEFEAQGPNGAHTC